MTKIKEKLLIGVILLLGLSFRLYGINWDQNQHLHPDERFLTMVTQAVEWPSGFSEYLDPNFSPLSPYNAGHSFFVYGTFPLKIVKLASNLFTLNQDNYHNITLVGRMLSALFDTATVLLVIKIGSLLFNKKVSFFSGLLYSISTLPVQLSHFYAVDTFLVFFLTLSFFLLLKLISKLQPLIAISLGISFGLAIAGKASAIFLLPIIVLGLGYLFLKTKDVKRVFTSSFVLLFSSYLSLKLADPRMFATGNLLNPSLNPQFLDNLNQLKSWSNPNTIFPPAVQWITTKPIIFPLKNLVLWGLGLPLGILSIAGIAYSISKLFKLFKNGRLGKLSDKQVGLFLILFWILSVFFYQGIQFAKAMRYLYPLYPFLAITTASFLYQCSRTLEQKLGSKLVLSLLSSLVLLSIIIWPVSFLSIYSRDHSRVTASKWIYENIPIGSTISCEHWDDCLPLPLKKLNNNYYQIETLELYNQDRPIKWNKVNKQLERVDYLILSSNRLWGSIPKVPEKYPITSTFYHDLFAEKKLSSGERFTKVAEFTSYPTIPIINITIPDQQAEESFTVYDHPKVIILEKVKASNSLSL